mgnify:CR=1 FL=1
MGHTDVVPVNPAEWREEVPRYAHLASLLRLYAYQPSMAATLPLARLLMDAVAKGYLGGTAAWRTDVYTGRGTLLTLRESIELNKKLGVKHTPELKAGDPQRLPLLHRVERSARAETLEVGVHVVRGLRRRPVLPGAPLPVGPGAGLVAGDGTGAGVVCRGGAVRAGGIGRGVGRGRRRQDPAW